MIYCWHRFKDWERFIQVLLDVNKIRHVLNCESFSFDLHLRWLCGWRGIFVGGACKCCSCTGPEVCLWTPAWVIRMYVMTVEQQVWHFHISCHRDRFMQVSNNGIKRQWRQWFVVPCVFSCCRWYHYITFLPTSPSGWWTEKCWHFIIRVQAELESLLRMQFY